ncbi:MAG TPA: hypothetical protein VHE55_10155 [Fimbriimonadaceae bacterium]|nr:hypothetical protein [Fimbriimonadaceae bacterium]
MANALAAFAATLFDSVSGILVLVELALLVIKNAVLEFNWVENLLYMLDFLVNELLKELLGWRICRATRLHMAKSVIGSIALFPERAENLRGKPALPPSANFPRFSKLKDASLPSVMLYTRESGNS